MTAQEFEMLNFANSRFEKIQEIITEMEGKFQGESFSIDGSDFMETYWRLFIPLMVDEDALKLLKEKEGLE